MALAVLLRDPEETPVALSRRPSAAGRGGGRRVGCAAGGPWGRADPHPASLAEVAGACALVSDHTAGLRRAPCPCGDFVAHGWPVVPAILNGFRSGKNNWEKKKGGGEVSWQFYLWQDRLREAGGRQGPARRRRGAELRLRDAGRRR